MKHIPKIILIPPFLLCANKQITEETPTTCALFIAKTITDPTSDYLIYAIAKEIGSTKPEKAASLIEHVHMMAGNINSTYKKGWFLAKVANAYANIGARTKAKEIILKAVKQMERLNAGEKKDILLREIAETYARIGELDLAFQYIERVKLSWIFSSSTPPIIAMYEKAGKKNKALELLAQFTKKARAITHPDMKAIALSSIVLVYLQCREFSNALKIANEISDAEDYIDFSEERLCSVRFKIKALIDIAGKQVELGKKNDALEILSKAFKIAEKIKHRYLKAEMMKDVAVAYMGAGKYISIGILGYMKIYFNSSQPPDSEKSLKLAHAIELPLIKAYTLYWIAMKYLHMKKQEKCLKILNEALKTADNISDDSDDSDISRLGFGSYSKSAVLTSIATGYAKAEEFEKALFVVHSIATIGNNRNVSQLDALNKIASVYMNKGDKRRALTILDESLDLANKIIYSCDYRISSSRKNEILIKSAELYRRAGSDEKAEEIILKLDPADQSAAKDNYWKKRISQALSIGDYEKALEFSSRIKEMAEQAKVLAVIGKGYPEPGKKISEKSREILRQILRSHKMKINKESRTKENSQ